MTTQFVVLKNGRRMLRTEYETFLREFEAAVRGEKEEKRK